LIHRVPLIVTTHLKKIEGLTEAKASTESFAYFKGARDASMALILLKDEEMKVSNQMLLKIVKGRKGQQGTILYQNDYETTDQIVIDKEFYE
jgi:hypothetical protein